MVNESRERTKAARDVTAINHKHWGTVLECKNARKNESQLDKIFRPACFVIFRVGRRYQHDRKGSQVVRVCILCGTGSTFINTRTKFKTKTRTEVKYTQARVNQKHRSDLSCNL